MTLIAFELLLTSLDVILEIWSFFAYRNLSFRGKRENVESLRLLGKCLKKTSMTLKLRGPCCAAIAKLIYSILNILALGFSVTEMIPQLLYVAYNVASTVGIAIPVLVDTVVTFLVSFQALSGPLCLLAIRLVCARPGMKFY